MAQHIRCPSLAESKQHIEHNEHYWIDTPSLTRQAEYEALHIYLCNQNLKEFLRLKAGTPVQLKLDSNLQRWTITRVYKITYIDVNAINSMNSIINGTNLYFKLEFPEQFRTEISPGLFGITMMGALSSLLTSKSPSGMPSKREGWIHFSITSHPPRFTALTLRLSRRCLRDCKAATPPGIIKVPETASSPSLFTKYWVWWCTCNSSKPEYTDLQNPETKLWQCRPFILEWILVPMSRRTKKAHNKEREIQYSFCVPLLD